MKHTTIYYVRHAQPLRSADSIYTDRTYPLTEKGLEDRKLVTEFLQDKNIDVILSSPFKRAVDTVAEFAEQFNHNIELIEDFRERAITDKWIGIEEFMIYARKQWEDFTYKLPKGESIAEVQGRNLAALANVLQKHRGKNIVIGGHGMALSTLLHHYDSSFCPEQHIDMPMPWVVKMVFDGSAMMAMEKIDLFNPDKEPDYNNLKVTTTELGKLKAYKYTVIFAWRDGKWLYCRQKNRDVFETPGGHIDMGETPLEGASRELREETGATKFSITPAFDYAVYTNLGWANGQVFFADIKELGELSENFEMSEVCGFRTVPDKMRFPKILPVLHEAMEKWLGLDKNKEEFLDVYDENRNLTGRIHRRTDEVIPGDFHLAARAWIMNKKGQFLITRRALNKLGFPGIWEIPAGVVSTGENSMEAAIREAKEENGITLLPEKAQLVSFDKRRHVFYDNWLFQQEFDLADVVLQEGETIDARAANWHEISAMMDSGEFISKDYFANFDLMKDVFK